MANIEKVIKGLERCLKHTCPGIYSKEYKECEYTVGLYCGKDKLLNEALDLLKEQRAEINLLKAEQPRWIPVEERLPEIEEGKEYFGTECIVCDKYKQVFTLRYCKHTVRKKEVYRWMRDDMSIYYGEVVYWMPFSLPKPPKEGEA